MDREQAAISGKPASGAMGAVLDQPLAATSDGSESQAETSEARPSIFRKAWNCWMKFAEIVGTVNMVIILSILYWTMVTVVAIPFRLASDPLRIKNRHGWVVRESSGTDMESMKNQY